jgi:hypothetical protein
MKTIRLKLLRAVWLFWWFISHAFDGMLGFFAFCGDFVLRQLQETTSEISEESGLELLPEAKSVLANLQRQRGELHEVIRMAVNTLNEIERQYEYVRRTGFVKEKR